MTESYTNPPTDRNERLQLGLISDLLGICYMPGSLIDRIADQSG